MRFTFLVRAAALAAGLLSAVVVSACSGGGEPTGSGSTGSAGGGGGSGGGNLIPSGFTCSGKKVSYKTDVAPLFAAHCAGVEGCHLPMHDADGAYKLLVGKPNDECKDDRDLVVPSDPEHSYAIHKITNTNVCAGSPMPKTPGPGTDWTTKLPDPLIQTIYDWVCQGAKND